MRVDSAACSARPEDALRETQNMNATDKHRRPGQKEVVLGMAAKRVKLQFQGCGAGVNSGICV